MVSMVLTKIHMLLLKTTEKSVQKYQSESICIKSF